jgi:hypothetical protein
MKHTLSARVSDARLALKLWFFSWLGLSIAGVLAAAWFLPPAGLEWAWRSYQIASISEGLGLGSIPLLNVGGSWVTPSDFIAWLSQKIAPDELADWADDLKTIALIPLLSAITLATAYLLFNFKKD